MLKLPEEASAEFVSTAQKCAEVWKRTLNGRLSQEDPERATKRFCIQTVNHHFTLASFYARTAQDVENIYRHIRSIVADFPLRSFIAQREDSPRLLEGQAQSGATKDFLAFTAKIQGRDHEVLEDLNKRLERAISSLGGISARQQDYLPHITVARISPPGRNAFDFALRECRPFRVDIGSQVVTADPLNRNNPRPLPRIPIPNGNTVFGLDPIPQPPMMQAQLPIEPSQAPAAYVAPPAAPDFYPQYPVRDLPPDARLAVKRPYGAFSARDPDQIAQEPEWKRAWAPANSFSYPVPREVLARIQQETPRPYAFPEDRNFVYRTAYVAPPAAPDFRPQYPVRDLPPDARLAVKRPYGAFSARDPDQIAQEPERKQARTPANSFLYPISREMLARIQQETPRLYDFLEDRNFVYRKNDGDLGLERWIGKLGRKLSFFESEKDEEFRNKLEVKYGDLDVAENWLEGLRFSKRKYTAHLVPSRMPTILTELSECPDPDTASKASAALRETIAYVLK